MSELKPCPFCGGEAQISEYYIRGMEFWAYCQTCTAESASGMSRESAACAWNTRADSLAITAAVQGEREAIKAALTEIAMIEHRASSEYFGSRHPVVGERWNNHAMGIEHAIEIIEKRPSPAVDVMAVVREYVKSMTDLDPVRGPQRYREALAALEALVTPTTTGMAKDGDKWDRTNEEEYRAHVEEGKDGGAKC